MNTKLWPVLALLYGSGFWGIVWYPARLLEAEGMAGLWFVLSAYTASFTLFSLFYGFPWRDFRQKPGETAWFLLAVGWANVAFIMALLEGEVVRVMILFYLSPLWTAALGAWLLGESINRLTGLMLGLGLSGALITLWDDQVTHTSISTADWLALSSGFAFALTNVLIRRMTHLPALHKNQLALIGILLMSLVWIITLNEPIPHTTTNAWVGAIGLGLLGFLFAGLCTVYGVSRMPVQRSAVIMLFELIVAAISAWLIIGEAISGQIWLGGSMIIIAGLVAVFATEKPA